MNALLDGDATSNRSGAAPAKQSTHAGLESPKAKPSSAQGSY